MSTTLLILMSLCSLGAAADWPQWRGPNRDGVCTETGLLKQWPEGGPRLLWEINGLGPGYSTVSIAKGKLFTMGRRKTADGQDRQCVFAYDLATRDQSWAAEVGPPHADGGPRCTPTVDGQHLYVIGTNGDLVCADVASGRIVWRKHLQRDLGGGANPGWRFSESPLVDGDRLICTPGGRRAVLAALDKKTGDVIWKASMPDIGPKGKDEAGYSSIVISESGGLRQYVQLTNKGLVGVSAADGRFLWGYNRIANRTANIPTPVVDGDSVFCSTAYGTGSALLRLSRAGKGIQTEEVYWLGAGKFQNHHGGFVRVGDCVYGGHGHGQGKPTCIELKTGKIMWQHDQPGGGSAGVLYADGHLYFRYENNIIALIEATPEGYRLKGQFQVPHKDGMDGPGWPHPVISDGKLYIRHADVLLCYDVKAGT